MKKMWKNLCVYSMVFACGVGLVGCGSDNVLTSKDLDGDGIISSWETVFDGNMSSTLMGDTGTAIGDIEYIGNAKELKNINNNTDYRKVYILKRDIDLGGETVCINLGSSSIYGNGHVISNFKLGTYYPEDYIITNEDTGETMERNPSGVRCLFYGGTNVYDVRIFAGNQEITLSQTDEVKNYTISPFVNTLSLAGVSVKEKLKLNVEKIDGEIPSLDASLLYASKSIESYQGVAISNVNMDNVSVDGCMDVFTVAGNIDGNIGYIANQLSSGSRLINGYAKVDMSVTASHKMNIGGIVGINNGFVSSCTTTGKMLLKFQASSIMGENIGGIVGMNGNVAEIKNCSTNVNIDFGASQEYASYSRDSSIYIGGIVGYNDGGVLECDQSDANISINDAISVYAGGIAGMSNRGIISYIICRGHINVADTKEVYVAQVSGYGHLGLFEKIITTTSIKVDNRNAESRVYAGMLTIFEEDASSMEASADNSPYFQKILVDGGTEVYMRSGDVFRYELGLRNKFRTVVGTSEGEGGEMVVDYESNFPEIFSNVQYTPTDGSGFSEKGCYLVKYNCSASAVEKDTSVVVEYARDETTKANMLLKYSGNSIGGLIQDLEFKNFLNHNEVNLKDNIKLSELCFTLTDEKKAQSYFHENRYSNVGFAHVSERNFSQSYIHEASGKHSCDYDKEDEYLSFLYRLIGSVNNAQVNCAFKISNGFLNLGEEDDAVTKLTTITSSLFNCISTPVTSTMLNSALEDINDPDNLGEDDVVRYIRFSFENTKKNYTMLLDVSNLLDVDMANETDEYQNIIYLMLTADFKVVGA